jgi:hypothetical protein
MGVIVLNNFNSIKFNPEIIFIAIFIDIINKTDKTIIQNRYSFWVSFQHWDHSELHKIKIPSILYQFLININIQLT